MIKDEQTLDEKSISSVRHHDTPGLSSAATNETANGGEGVATTMTSIPTTSPSSVGTTKSSTFTTTTTKKPSVCSTNKRPSSNIDLDLADDVDDGEKSSLQLTKKQKMCLGSTTMEEQSDAKRGTAGSNDIKNLPVKSDLIVFLDIDMTMIYTKCFGSVASADDYVASLPKHPKSNKTVENVRLENGSQVVLLRPGIKAFIQKVSTTFETHIFTAGCKTHAFEIASILDPDKKIFSEGNIWFNEHCEYKHFTKLRILPIKNLSKLPPVRDSKKGSKRAVLVDDWEIHMDASPMVVVEEFRGDPSDNELDKVWKILEALKDNTVDVPHTLATLLGNEKENVASANENEKIEERPEKQYTLPTGSDHHISTTMN